MVFVERTGVRLHVVDEGSGFPILFHTGGCGDGRMWDLAGYRGSLAGRRHLVLDHRGHGLSDQPTGLAAHRLEEYVADVLSVLDATGVDQVDFVGYSAGATVGYAFAAAHPDRVRTLVGLGAVGTPGEAGTDEELAVADEVRGRGLRAFFEEAFADEFAPPPPWLLDQLCSTDPEMFALLLEAWAPSTNPWSDFPRVVAPTLLIVGEHEEPDAGAHVAAAAALMSQGSAQVLDDLGHLEVFWRSDLTVPLIEGFLSRAGAG